MTAPIILDEAHFEQLARDGYIIPAYFSDTAEGHFAHYRSRHGRRLRTTQLDVPLCAECEKPVDAANYCAYCDEDCSLVPVEWLSAERIVA